MTNTAEHSDTCRTLTVEQAAVVLGIGRSAAYAAARAGELPTIRLGRAIRVPKAKLDAMLGQAESQAPE